MYPQADHVPGPFAEEDQVQVNKNDNNNNGGANLRNDMGLDESL